MLPGKNILLGVTGSIAAYKSAFLTRLLVKAGYKVKVVMTPAAKDFITPLTLSTLSNNPVLSEFTSGKEGAWNNHVELAQWADLLLIAPATADTIAKMANGICDTLLLAVYLSADCKVVVAPAMDREMFQHPATRKNLEIIKSFGVVIIPPDKGELASGLIGEGRMAEPEQILQFISRQSKKKVNNKLSLPLSGKKALVTAGPTYEALDPVRFIGNYSSGKMGFALAEELAQQGADVTLVCGPNALSVENPAIKRVDVTSAGEMFKQCMKAKHADVIVMAAAVADFGPAKKAKQKIKKEEKLNHIELVPTKDILAELGKNKNGSVLVGFALETENEIQNAKKKLRNKNLDYIVLNSLKDSRSGFGYDTNRITIIDRKNVKKFDLMSKKEAAHTIVQEISKKIK